MFKLAVTVGFLNLLAAMSPGPDFAVVTKNALVGTRKSGFFTAFGIATALMIHITYCALGLATVIIHSPTGFFVVKIIGGCYLIYLGVLSFKQPDIMTKNQSSQGLVVLSHWQAFKDGFLTNLLNPKAALFLLSIFTWVLNSQPAGWFMAVIAVELFFVVLAWFCCVSWMVTHPVVYKAFLSKQTWILRGLGLFLIVFGVSLFFFHP